ncbi:MAG: HIT family protein [Candidatus Altiarchaeota archaeon]|nr:HIT family protein [Candidatus Altiarchaeota archaeon]
MTDCVFCKIIDGSIPSFKFWENQDFIAILDIQPNTSGMTLIIPKTHYDSYVFDMPTNIYEKFLVAAREVSKLLDTKLGTRRTAMVMEGMGVNHAHIKLYPMHGLTDKFKPSEQQGVFFDNYPGYITTKLGPKADMDKLSKLAKKLRG